MASKAATFQVFIRIESVPLAPHVTDCTYQMPYIFAVISYRRFLKGYSYWTSPYICSPIHLLGERGVSPIYRVYVLQRLNRFLQPHARARTHCPSLKYLCLPRARTHTQTDKLLFVREKSPCFAFLGPPLPLNLLPAGANPYPSALRVAAAEPAAVTPSLQRPAAR